jgi:nucleotide-binding universal stress UspA family protein
VATALIAPTEDPKVLAPAGPRKLLACFSSSDDWKALVTMAGKLAIPGNAAVQVCYKDLANQPATDGTTLCSLGHRRPFDCPPSSLRVAQALRDLGLNVEFTDLPALRRESHQKLSSTREADLIVMTTAFSRSIALCSHASTSRAVRLLGKPILFLQADRRPSAAPQNRTGPAVVAVSLSERSMPVVQLAAQYAETLGSSLTVVHVVDSLHDFSRPDNLMSLMCACEILGKSVAQPGLRTYPRLTYGTVADVLTKADFIGNAPFVALGVDLSEPQSDAMESDALRDTIVQSAPCPVLLIPTNQQHSVA